MSIKDTLHTVVTKVSQNLVNVENALKQAEAPIVQADHEAVAAAKTLLAKFGHPQAAVQILQNVAQLDALTDTKTEMKAMIVGLEHLLTKGGDDIEAELEKLLHHNEQQAQSPLSDSGAANSSDSGADAGAGSEAATPAA